MARERAGIVLRQVLIGSVFAWIVNGLLTASIHLFGDRPWGEAFEIGSIFTTLLVIGYGAVGIGVDVVPIPSNVFRMFASERRTRVADDPGELTPFGLALFVVPQLVVVAALLG